MEDEPRFAATLGMGLRAEGFVVVHVDNGVDGLQEATENSFDVIVLDMLTAKDGDYDQTDAFDLGADDFLSKLMRHEDTVVTQNEMLQHVWDAHYAVPDYMVEVYVGHLRHKINNPLGTNTIQTVRGAGYRLESGEYQSIGCNHFVAERLCGSCQSGHPRRRRLREPDRAGTRRRHSLERG